MNQLPKGSRGATVPPQRPTSVDLILQARAMRHRWFVSAFARLAAKAARFAPELVTAAWPGRTLQPAAPERLRFSGRPVT
jgi:hypothetical protein